MRKKEEKEKRDSVEGGRNRQKMKDEEGKAKKEEIKNIRKGSEEVRKNILKQGR